MFKYLFLFFSSIVLLAPSSQTPALLLPVVKDRLYGFINTAGELVIDYQYQAASVFAEGLAPVRTKGQYGYINTKGATVIDFVYDYATPFQEGLALAYVDGYTKVINLHGEVLLALKDVEVDLYAQNQLLQITTKSDKHGLLDLNGNYLIDTLFETLRLQPAAGVAIVTYSDTLFYEDDDYDLQRCAQTYSLKTGAPLTAKNQFRKIAPYRQGYTIATEEDNPQQSVIDLNGNKVLTEPEWEWQFTWQPQTFQHNLVLVEFNFADYRSRTTWTSSIRYGYKGAIKLNGEVAFKDERWEEITPFAANGRAFAQDTLEKWHLIDTSGQVISSNIFDHVIYERGEKYTAFADGRTLVVADSKAGIINDQGDYVVAPRALPMENEHNLEYLQLHGNIVLYHDEAYVSAEDNYEYLLGFWDLRSGYSSGLKYEALEVINDDLLLVREDGLQRYLSNRGACIWQEETEGDTPYSLDVDFMVRAYFYANNFGKEEEENAYDYLGSYGNPYQALHTNKQLRKSEKGLSLRIDDSMLEVDENGVNCYPVYLVNNSADTVSFSVQDNRLYLIAEALNEMGQWRAIEYLPSSWCGNSYYTNQLPNGHYWAFMMPVYQGATTTKVRLSLNKQHSYLDGKDVLYSNVVEMSVNPAQYWRQRPYYSQGLMDPYDE